MNSPKLVLLAITLSALMASLGTASSSSSPSTSAEAAQKPETFNPQHHHHHHHKRWFTCDKYPWACSLNGSPGPVCCRKRCVNVKEDMYNCGKCGKKCKYYETCCQGKCINTWFDPDNCGGCGLRCKKGTRCAYGFCNYAY